MSDTTTKDNYAAGTPADGAGVAIWTRTPEDNLLYRSNARDLCAAVEAGVSLRGADLHFAFLHGGTFAGADLNGADLQSADLQGADLRDTLLRRADFVGANLQDADLRGAEVEGANFRDANLRGTRFDNLSGALFSSQMRGMRIAKDQIPMLLESLGVMVEE